MAGQNASTGKIDTAAVAAQVAERARQTPAQPERVDVTPKGNPIAVVLGKPTFRLVSNGKWYQDDNNVNKSSMRLAFVDFTLGGLVLSASVYVEKEITQSADGRYEEMFSRLSMPKAISVDRDDAETVMNLQAFKEDTLDAFTEWQKGIGGGDMTARVSKQQDRRRMGERKRIVEAPAAPPA